MTLRKTSNTIVHSLSQFLFPVDSSECRFAPVQDQRRVMSSHNEVVIKVIATDLRLRHPWHANDVSDN